MSSKMQGVDYDTENVAKIASYQQTTDSANSVEETLHVTESGDYFIRRKNAAQTERGEQVHDGQSDDSVIHALDEGEVKKALAWLDRTAADVNEDAFRRSIREATTTIEMEEFVSRLTGEVRSAQVSLSTFMSSAEGLHFIVHARSSQSDAIRGILEDIDRVEIDGVGYWATFEVSPFGPQELGRVTVYAADDIIGTDPVPVEEGIERLEDLIENRFDDSTGSSETALN